uniref:Secreted protein n=1 Tax=Phakopsora pachyrhizi TaxID=170000 RepID=A0A0S1MJH2_PHAPC
MSSFPFSAAALFLLLSCSDQLATCVSFFFSLVPYIADNHTLGQQMVVIRR